jgi:hypothetical protein
MTPGRRRRVLLMFCNGVYVCLCLHHESEGIGFNKFMPGTEIGKKDSNCSDVAFNTGSAAPVREKQCASGRRNDFRAQTVTRVSDECKGYLRMQRKHQLSRAPAPTRIHCVLGMDAREFF